MDVDSFFALLFELLMLLSATLGGGFLARANRKDKAPVASLVMFISTLVFWFLSRASIGVWGAGYVLWDLLECAVLASAAWLLTSGRSKHVQGGAETLGRGAQNGTKKLLRRVQRSVDKPDLSKGGRHTIQS